jgi:hypothetical protein
MIKYLFGLPFSRRQKKLAADRMPMTKAAFVADIVASGGDSQAASLVWDRLAAWRIVESFTPYPDDSLSRVFGIADEELDDDLIVRMFEELNLILPEQKPVREFGVIDSARRAAQFVSLCRTG